ncbi:hypothetical protein PENARI_c053G05477 [Penicillium arizonense]|uniref:Biogenesis of lysosome-related organelles complex 1 subunit KXD1 n=1 Tax=Penicillium arizonense TaxID=1835702 RepID=A0A1F5L213_PENAI|nr:hypothetical protein PENARI_c053G05477 [Penicillium arizonense]OGE47245.1 hypothetical protein PENARI_c053G05477 [Penicillium arizonense]
MDASNSTPDQENDGKQQPSALPIVCEKDNSQELSDHSPPSFAFPTARLVGLYRRLRESCVSKHIDGQKLEQSNQILNEAGTHLLKERDGLQLRHDKQLSRLRFFEQALESSRGRLTRLLDVVDSVSSASRCYV